MGLIEVPEVSKPRKMDFLLSKRIEEGKTNYHNAGGENRKLDRIQLIRNSTTSFYSKPWVDRRRNQGTSTQTGKAGRGKCTEIEFLTLWLEASETYEPMKNFTHSQTMNLKLQARRFANEDELQGLYVSLSFFLEIFKQ